MNSRLIPALPSAGSDQSPSSDRMRSTPASSLAVVLASLLALGACSGGSDTPRNDGLSGGAAAADGGGGAGSDNPGGDTSGGGTGGQESSRETSLGPNGYVRADGVEACSVEDLNAWIDHDMHDYYIYHDQVPVVNLGDYDDPAALLADLVVPPDRFSFFTEAAPFEQSSGEGIRTGYGFRLAYEADGTLRFRTVDPGSPTDDAGIRRGDLLLALDGTPQGELSDDEFSAIIDSGEASFDVQTPGGRRRFVTLRSTEYRFLSAEPAGYFTVEDGRRIGHLTITAFAATTGAEIDNHIAFMRDNGVQDLIVDLRYNGGGLSIAAQRLASQIAGAAVAGETYERGEFNDDYVEFDYTREFEAVEPTLALSRVVVLTTERTASASEALINGLAPFIDVTTIGTRTVGKPFAGIPVTYCGKLLIAESVLTSNDPGVSVVDGIAPDCEVEDRWLYPEGDSRDALMGAGLAWLVDGSCTGTGTLTATAGRRELKLADDRVPGVAELGRPGMPYWR